MTDVVARLNARVQPLDRGDLFEDPLDDLLQEAKLGSVSGGGTQLAAEPDGIAFCDLDLDLVSADDAVLDRVVTALEAMGAPKGSTLLWDAGKSERPFGRAEGLGLFLNGTDLPAEVYENNDINALIGDLQAALGDGWRFMGYWQGQTGTALYFYGDSYERMAAAIAAVVAGAALCQNARVAQIA